METRGWLFDLYPLGNRVVLWFITPEGRALRLEEDFPYTIYLGGAASRVRQVLQTLRARGWVSRYYPSRGLELASGKEIPVVALEPKTYGHLSRLRSWLGKLQGQVEVFNADLDVSAYYLYRRDLWPCTWYDLEVQEGRLLALAPREEQFARDFDPPPLTTLGLSLTRDPLIPLGAGNSLAITWEDRTLELEVRDRTGLVKEVARWLKKANPDLVLSDWGDEEIVPLLWHWSKESHLPLPLDREPGVVSRKFSGGRTYFSYGRIVYQGQAAPFFGRWHVDRKNSFFFREADLPGLMQIARLGQLPLQQAARASPGTLITSMQLARAVKDSILIPWRKADPERFKSAGELLTGDKGGLVFMPPIGLFFEVAELDFSSMYPTIMSRHNLSPETVNCRCCGEAEGYGGERAEGRGPSPHNSVPETGYRLCRRREGLVPRTLKPILKLREALKGAAREAGPEAAARYHQRQNALKWMLVTCFGYLGYKNARFGRIEAHEAVTAFGRDKLLTAKEICETAGFQVLHALTDCLWIKKEGMTEAELQVLCQEISAVTGVRMALEGVYRWLVFLPSRQNPARPVATRYFGVFRDGTLKVRGLLCRRRDPPPLVRRAQEALLTCLAAAATPEELAALKPELLKLSEGFRQRLREGGIPPGELVVTRVLSRTPAEFKVDTATALAVRQLAQAGISLRPGEKVRYVHREGKNGAPECRIRAAPFLEDLEDYDTRFYLNLLERAFAEIFTAVYGNHQGGNG